MKAIIRYSSDWQEFRVETPDGGTYYTDDKADAIGTAKMQGATEIAHRRATPAQNENW